MIKGIRRVDGETEAGGCSPSIQIADYISSHEVEPSRPSVQRPFLPAAPALARAGTASAQSPRPPAAGQTPAPAPLPSESEAERAAVVERLATVLDENFV